MTQSNGVDTSSPSTSTKAKLLSAISWLVAIGAVGLGTWAFIRAVQAEPAIVGSVATAALAAGGVIWQQHRAERERLAEVRRARMTPIYEDLLGFVMRGEQADQGGEPPEDLTSFMKNLKGRELLLGASPEMINAFNSWQADTVAAEKDGNALGAVEAYEALLRAIRRDLGHDDSGLPQWDLLRVFINDIDEHLPKEAPLKAVA